MENLQNGLRHLAITPFAHSSGRLNDIPEQSQLVARRPSILLQEILSTRRPSAIMAAIRRPSNSFLNRSRLGAFQEDNHNGSTRSINFQTGPKSEMAIEFRRKNRRVGK